MLNLLERIIASLAAIAMGSIVIIVFGNVIMRYVFNTGLTWSDEVSVNLFVWFIFLGGILAAMEGMHLKVDVFTNNFSERGQRIFELVAKIFVLLAMGILTLGGVRQVEVTSLNISSATGLPFSYITISMVIFSVAVILITLMEMKELVKGRGEGNASGRS